MTNMFTPGPMELFIFVVITLVLIGHWLRRNQFFDDHRLPPPYDSWTESDWLAAFLTFILVGVLVLIAIGFAFRRH